MSPKHTNGLISQEPNEYQTPLFGTLLLLSLSQHQDLTFIVSTISIINFSLFSKVMPFLASHSAHTTPTLFRSLLILLSIPKIVEIELAPHCITLYDKATLYMQIISFIIAHDSHFLLHPTHQISSFVNIPVC